MRPLAISLTALLLVPASVGTVSAHQAAASPLPVGATETVPCPAAVVKGAALTATGQEVEGQTYSCGVVVVPENHDRPDGRTIELFYLKLHSPSATPAAQPVVYLAGGPGGSGSNEVTTNPVLYANLQAIREDRDIIAYDQRGTGFSDYLLCAPFESALGILEDRDTNPEIAETVKRLQDTDLGIGYDALRANLCGVVTKLLAGVDLSQYNSVSSARDIQAVATALGYTEGYDLFGTSYGTRLAQYAMRQTPDSVRAVVLDGVSPVSAKNVMWSFAKRDVAYSALFEQCAANAACNAAYPDLPARFAALLTKLAETPLVFDPPMVVNPQLTFGFPAVLKQIDPDFFVQLAGLNNLVVNGGFAGAIPRMILAAEQEDLDFFRGSSLAAKPGPTEEVQTVPGVGADSSPQYQAEQPLFQAPFQMLLVLAQATAAQAQAGPDSQWISIALGDLAARLAAGEPEDDLMETLLRLTVLPNTGTTAGPLTEYAAAYLSPAAAEAADAVVAQMSRNDVRATMWGIQDIAMLLGAKQDARSASDGMTNAFNCSDEVAFSSLDDAQGYLDRSPFPQLTVLPFIYNEQFLASCVAYPSALDASVTEPVVSDIPALVYLGQLDTQTPVTWGREVAGTLGDATVVEWPNQGHIAITHDQGLCAGTIAAAFLADPAAEPDLSCAAKDDYTVKFVLPQ
jgi:pimeloyl-ACP methyl ester carboxylesterase